jgi:hypothetical protein
MTIAAYLVLVADKLAAAGDLAESRRARDYATIAQQLEADDCEDLRENARLGRARRDERYASEAHRSVNDYLKTKPPKTRAARAD